MNPDDPQPLYTGECLKHNLRWWSNDLTDLQCPYCRLLNRYEVLRQKAADVVTDKPNAINRLKVFLNETK